MPSITLPSSDLVEDPLPAHIRTSDKEEKEVIEHYAGVKDTSMTFDASKVFPSRESSINASHSRLGSSRDTSIELEAKDSNRSISLDSILFKDSPATSLRDINYQKRDDSIRSTVTIR